MLFYCVWAEEHALLVDVADEAAARAAAVEEVGSEPKAIRAIPPGVFGARVVFEDDPDDTDAEIVSVEALPHVLDILGAIEDEYADDDGETELVCASEAEDDQGKVVRCERVTDHVGDHESSGGLSWPNERKRTG